MGQLRRSMHRYHPVEELLTRANEDAVVVDGVLVVDGPQQLPVQPIDPARVRHQAVVNRLAILQLTESGLELSVGHARIPPQLVGLTDGWSA